MTDWVERGIGHPVSRDDIRADLQILLRADEGLGARPRGAGLAVTERCQGQP